MRIKKIVVGDLETNCYLLELKEGLVIIDPGGDTKKILEAIKDRILEVKYVINTHGHPDHTLANREIKKATGAKILIHEAEKRLINFHVDQYLHEGDIICIGDLKLKVIHTPGHTPGGICLLENNFTPYQVDQHDNILQFNKSEDGTGFIFTGDTLFLNGHGRTDLEWSSEEDMKKSLKRLNQIIKPGMMVYPGHGGYSQFSV